MRSSSCSICAALILGLAILSPFMASAQGNKPVVATSASSPAGVVFVTGQSFSAIKYSRKVKMLPSGKQHFIRNERYPVQVARDSEGRIRMQGVDPLPECDQPELLVPPTCPVWRVLIFDPTSQTITHWLEGERAAHNAIVLKLSAAQVDEVANSVSTLPSNEPDWDTDGAIITREELGERIVEGVRAMGLREKKVIPAGHLGNKMPITRIHEVWTSEEMKLVVRIIDGDPQGDETISGLEKVSLQPDAALFQPPGGYELKQTDSRGKFVGRDMPDLAGWFITHATLTMQ